MTEEVETQCKLLCEYCVTPTVTWNDRNVGFVHILTSLPAGPVSFLYSWQSTEFGVVYIVNCQASRLRQLYENKDQ